MHPEELIADYIDYEALIPALKDGNYTEVTKRVREAIAQICRAYTEDGTLSPEEAEEEITLTVNCLNVVMQYHVMYALFEALGCEPAETAAARADMVAEYRAWKEKAPFGEKPWLVDLKGKPLADKGKKLRIFKAIDALLLSAEDFDSIPPMPLPHTHEKVYGDFAIVTVSDIEITDDGGFSQDADPVGKSYVLTDSDGAVYHLNNVCRSAVPGGLSTEGAQHLAATGWIAGYTSEQPREIEFEVHKGRFTFTYSTKGVEQADAEADTLNKAYLAWSEAFQAARRARIKALFQ